MVDEQRAHQHPWTEPRQPYGLVLFDVDGTLVATRSGDRFRRTPRDWHLLPGRRMALAVLRHALVQVALVSNQGGAAFGYYQAADMQAELQALCALLGLEWRTALYVCYHHPDASVPGLRRACERRKPAPGMLREAMVDHDVGAARTLMVGDRDEDAGAARAAGCAFLWADDFFALEREEDG